MENEVPKITLQSNHRQTRPWVWLTIIGVLLLFMNQNVIAQTPCTTPINYTLVGVDATTATANDAKIRISGALSGDNKIGYSVGNTYTGPNFAAATKFSDLTGGYISQTLPTPTNPAGTEYTIRVFSEDGSCYTDKTFTLDYVNFNSTPVNPDIEVTTGVSPSGFVALNGTVSIVITVQNKGTGPATGVVYTVGIPAGLTGVTGTPTAGTYNGTTTWTIGDLAVNQTVTLTLTGTVSTRGVKYVTANLSAENEQDIDSSPTTNNAGEDDQGSACISTPFDYCSNDEYTITLPSYTDIKWFKGATEITAGNAASNGVRLNGDGSMTIFSEGEYSYSMTVGPNACPSGGCCPIKIEAGKPPVLVAPADQSICFNATFATITAQNTQTTPNGTFIYEWYNDNGTSNPTTGIISGQTSLTFTALPTAVGVYKYKLKAYEQGHPNCADSITITLEIKDLPVPVIASNSPVCEEGTITFTSDGAGTGGSYAWTGPASFTANTANPTRTNAVEAYEGTYVVTVTNGVACSATASVAVVINPLPEPPVTADKVFCAEDAAAPLVATAASGNTLLWYGTSSTGGVSSTTVPVYNPTTAGIDTYYVTQVDVNGCESHRADIEVTVNAKPAPPTVTTPVSACQDSDPVTLAVNGTTTGYTILWYGTASTGSTGSTTATVALTNAVGTTTYYVSRKDDVTTCESNRASIDVEIRPTPVPTIASNSPVCAEGTITFTSDGAGTGGSYAWTGPASFTANTANPTRTNAIEAHEGTYVVTVTNGVACSATASVAVVINPLPELPVTADKVFCAEDAAATLVATAASGNTLLWYGTSSTGGVSSTTAPVYNPTTAGIDTYYVTQVDVNGCESHRAELEVTVNAKPAAPVAQDKTYCQGVAAVALTASGVSGNPILWYGTNSTGGTGDTTAPIPLTDAVGTTTYYVSQKDATTGCESNRDDAIVIVNRTPEAPAISPVVYCEQETATALAATGESGNSIIWHVGGSSTLTAPTPNTSVAGLTMFYVSQSIPGTGCESGMAQIPVTVNPKPVATVIAVNSLCVGSVSQNNAQLILTRYRNSDEVSYNIGSTYGTPTPSTYATVPSGGVFASNLPNPTAATQDYTVRIKNSFNCTIDRVATLTKTDCACPGGYCEPATVTKTK
ncbi:DUF11 domain-containing protein [Emticicia sp. BO119]|uniref:Ig-like domain-containing protein n=1 Tax=Emticicia sp. BO119 TaxID=2757768 RepID=UPI0015F1162E|nr:DUF11 domain-containing protein [Emticicia sp. BO119]MBA4852785.1 DUF11 domain-containing protein [Emticicia sp. BO119]